MLGTPNSGRARPKSRTLDLGFKRIWAVRVWTGAGPTRYEVQGVVHRSPITRRVTAGMATRLVALGVPLVIRERETAAEAQKC